MDKLSDVFDVAAVRLTEFPVAIGGAEKIGDDSNESRSNIKQLITVSTKALEHALELAVQSDSPRAYEVLATLINISADLNTKLMAIHQAEQKITNNKPEASNTPTSVTNNVIFNGTTQELNDHIMKRLKQ